MRWVRRHPTAWVGVATAVALIAGVVLGDARTDDARPQLPHTGPAVASAAPGGSLVDVAADGELDERGSTDAPVSSSVAAGSPIAHDPVLARVFDPASGVGSDAPGPIVQPAGAPLPSPGDDGPPDPTEPDADAEPVDDGGDAEPTDEGGEAEPVGGVTGLLGLDGITTWFVRFVDACADDPGSEGCPLGVGGSILTPISDDVATLPPIDVARHTYAHLPVDEARCPQGRRADGKVDVFLSTNVPARSLRVEQVAGGRTLQQWDLVTSEEEARHFDRFWLAGSVPHTLLVRHCFTVDDWERTDSHLQVRAEDHAGNVVEKAVRLEIIDIYRAPAPGTGRPPVTVAADGERLRVGVPIDGDVEQAWVVTLHRVGTRATDDTCTSIEGDVLDRRYRGGVDTINGRWERLAAGDHDPRYDRLEQWFVYPGEGAVIDVCTWITTAPARSFDRPVVQLRQTQRVQAPRHYRTTIQVTELVFDEDVAAGSLEVAVPDWVGAPSVSLPDTDLPAGYFPTARTAPAIDSGPAPHPDRTFLRITGPSGKVAWRAVPTPLACASPCDGMRIFQLPIPGPSFVDEICGGFACGDRPDDAIDGLVTIAVTTTPGPSGPPDGATPTGWTIGAGQAFGPAGAADPGPIPRLDWNGTRGAATVEDGEVVVQLVLPFDREVVLDDVMADVDPTGPCATAPVRSATPARTHRVVVRGACAGQWYTFGFLATATDGGSFDLRPWVEGRPTGRSGLIPVATPAHVVRSLGYEVVLERAGVMVVDAVDLVVAGRSIPLVAPYAGPWACHGESDLPVRRTGTLGEAGSARPAHPLADPITVQLRVRAHECDGEARTLDLAAAPRLADLLAGPVTLRGEGSAGTAEVTITVTP